jgi:hypothetical protein
MGKKQICYAAEFKLIVTLYADENGKQAAAQFYMDPKCVSTWCNHKELSFQK